MVNQELNTFLSNNMKIIETERLYLREMIPEDAEQIYLLNLDPEVIKYTGDNQFQDIESARQFLDNYNHYKTHGFGRWAVVNKLNDEFLGWCGLKYTEQLNEVDVGFRFFKKHWNKGYATESAKACLDLGFEKFELQKIVGRAMKENVGSIRVLEKIGLLYSGYFNFDEHNGVLYTIEKPIQANSNFR